MSGGIANSNRTRAASTILPVADYDLSATLSSGQVFNWEQAEDGSWTGVVAGRWVRLIARPDAIEAQAAELQDDWRWLRTFLQTEVNLTQTLATFPEQDEHLLAAVRACRGLRLLRQNPWECLASFILSSTKQIVQIRQIVRSLCQRYGQPVASGGSDAVANAFPTPARIAALSETDLRACKMGFRAPYLLAAARRVAAGEINLDALAAGSMNETRLQLLRLDGVGEKIADCVLLFAYGYPTAFPVDVWVQRVITKYYFRNRTVRPVRLRRFITEHFGENAGYCQQYLFHYIRTQSGKNLSSRSG